ncbi:MAG: hypothetical protein QM817_06810 [Archangium sp.]
MWPGILVAVIAGASPFGDTASWSVSRTEEIKVLPADAGAAVTIRLVTTVISSEEQERSFMRAAVRLPDGRSDDVTRAITERINQGLDDGTLREAQDQLAHGGFGGFQSRTITVDLNRAPWLDVRVCDDEMGAYPSTSCAHVRVNVETGSEWTWTDAILPQRRAQFFTATTPRFAREAKKQQDAWGDDENFEFVNAYGLFPNEFDARRFDDAELDDEGLALWVGTSAPHVLQGAMWRFALPASALKKFVDPAGPLGHLVAQK